MGARSQTGAVLLVTVIAVLVLSVIAVTATNTNQVQQMLLHSNQLQMQAFNASYNELQSQLSMLQSLSDEASLPEFLEELINQGQGASLSTRDYAEQTQTFGLRSFGLGDDVEKTLSLNFRRLTSYPLVASENVSQTPEQDNKPKSQGVALCYEFEFVVDAQVLSNHIHSTQHQVFEYLLIDPSSAAAISESKLPNALCESGISCQCAQLEGSDRKRIFRRSWWEVFAQH